MQISFKQQSGKYAPHLFTIRKAIRCTRSLSKHLIYLSIDEIPKGFVRPKGKSIRLY